LRYAAFALVLVAAATVTFMLLRDRRARPVVETTAARNETETAERKQYQDTKPEVDSYDKAIAKSVPAPQPTKLPNVAAKQEDSLVAQNAQPAAAAKRATEARTNNSALAANQAVETQAAQAAPSFAPPPPGENERAQKTQNRESQIVGGLGGRKDESANANFGALDRSTSNDVRNTRSGVMRTEPGVSNRPAVSARRAADDKSRAKVEQADTLSVTSGSASEMRIEAAPKEVAKRVPAPTTPEEPQETRAGGHKFHRQGNAWVDSKFKSSMPVKSVARGSDDYRELDAAIRSIADKLSGEILVVWKGKAYRIH
jgi:hypothetical protein